MPAKKAARSAKKAARSAKKGKAKPKRSPNAASFGRPGTGGKGDGRAAVEAWIKAVKPSHKAIVQAVDRIVTDEVPDARFAIKWSTPLYGREGIGWFAAMASFKEHVGVNFFNGVALTPEPPAGESKAMRGIRIGSQDDLDEKQLRAWIRQASKNKGWGKI